LPLGAVGDNSRLGVTLESWSDLWAASLRPPGSGSSPHTSCSIDGTSVTLLTTPPG